MKKNEVYIIIRSFKNANFMLCGVLAVVLLITYLGCDTYDTYTNLLIAFSPAGLLQIIYEMAFRIAKCFLKP